MKRKKGQSTKKKKEKKKRKRVNFCSTNLLYFNPIRDCLKFAYIDYIKESWKESRENKILKKAKVKSSKIVLHPLFALYLPYLIE